MFFGQFYQSGRAEGDFRDRHPDGDRDGAAVAAVPLPRRARRAAPRPARAAVRSTLGDGLAAVVLPLGHDARRRAVRRRRGGRARRPREEIAAQARRMLDDPKARDAVAKFHEQWLDYDRIASVGKDAALFPEWSTAIGRADARGDARLHRPRRLRGRRRPHEPAHRAVLVHERRAGRPSTASTARAAPTFAQGRPRSRRSAPAS